MIGDAVLNRESERSQREVDSLKDRALAIGKIIHQHVIQQVHKQEMPTKNCEPVITKKVVSTLFAAFLAH